MRLTLKRAKEALRGKAPADKLEFRLNRACERLMTSGKYSGSMHRLALAAPFGNLTLPRHYRTIEGVRTGGRTLEIANRWYEFLPGRFDCSGYSMENVRDIGDGWAVMRDLPLGGSLKFDYVGTSTITLTVSGLDTSGMPLELVFSGKGTQMNTFSQIDRVHKEEGTLPIILSHVAADTTETMLAMMEPKEEETFYRRYMMDSLATKEDVAVTALCKRRHIEFTSDKDVLPFSNISALELALDALQYEAENDHAVADAYWAKAIKVLNDELGDTNTTSSMPTIRFVYPGRTAPNFRSTM
jgi:hypothetical protein